MPPPSRREANERTLKVHPYENTIWKGAQTAMKASLKKGGLYTMYILFSIWFGMAVEIALIYPIEII